MSGSHNITLGNTNLITSLGTISLGTGNLQVDDFSINGFSIIGESPQFDGITMSGTSATATFNIVNDLSASVYLSGSESGVDASTAANNFAPGVSVVVNGVAPDNGGPTTGDFFFRNSNDGATLGQVTLNNFTPGNLAIQFDNASITIDPSQSILAGFCRPGPALQAI